MCLFKLRCLSKGISVRVTGERAGLRGMKGKEGEEEEDEGGEEKTSFSGTSVSCVLYMCTQRWKFYF